MDLSPSELETIIDFMRECGWEFVFGKRKQWHARCKKCREAIDHTEGRFVKGDGDARDSVCLDPCAQKLYAKSQGR